VLSPESLDAYRRMTLTERVALVFKMMDDEIPFLLAGPPEVVDRRFELLRRENDLRNSAMLEALEKAKANDERA
jgi:hypothetical protein